MDATQEIIMIFGMTLVTFGVRYPVLALVGRLELPPRVLHALKFVPVAVLTAIIMPVMLVQDNTINLRLDNAYLVAGIISVLISWRTKNLLLTIVLGMGVFLVWRVAFG